MFFYYFNYFNYFNYSNYFKNFKIMDPWGFTVFCLLVLFFFLIKTKYHNKTMNQQKQQHMELSKKTQNKRKLTNKTTSK